MARQSSTANNGFVRQLRAELGQVRADAGARAAYTSDASIYRAVPVAVVEPRSTEEVAAAVRIAGEHGVAVTCRGGGTSIAGNAIGSGLVIDFSRHLNRVLDVSDGLAVVEPGAVLEDVCRAAASQGLTVGPDPSTRSRCTIGGMVGNNACGPHSVAWGTTAANVERLDLLLADGRMITATAGTSGDPDIDRRLLRLRDEHLTELRTELGRFPRQVSGYGLSHLLPEHGFHVARALVGSEGTCAVLTGATIRLATLPAAKVLLVLGFPDVYAAAAQAPALAAAGALTVEGMDAELIAALQAGPDSISSSTATRLPPGQGWLYCEVGGRDLTEAEAAARALAELADAATPMIVTDPGLTAALWQIRRDGAGIATRLADGGEAWPGWEDSAVPAPRLAEYLRDLHALLAEHGRRGISYGHFGEGCLHLRVDWDLTTERGIAEYRAFIEQAAELVISHGGCPSGEHGDGRARSELLARTYSAPLMSAFAEFKRVWDPENRLNPGVLVDPAPLDADIRPGPGHDRLVLPVLHALSGDGGSFSAAVRRCVGVGSCRQSTGAMCPSFQVTKDEVHSTRGRARVLSEMLRGELLDSGWRSTEVRDALDLCLSCKACRRDCPVQVDMATYKAEFLYRHYKGRLRPRAHYVLGWLPVLLRMGGMVPRLANAATGGRRSGALLSRLAGLEPRRQLIRLGTQPFQRWWRRREPAGPGTAGTVVLWPDTFTNFLSPQVGRAAVEVLEALGYRVELPAGRVCCGLTWHSTGQLATAKRVLRRSVRALAEPLKAGHLIIGLEPSCTVMLREEAAELVPDEPAVDLLHGQTRTLAELVAEHRGDWPFGRLDAAAVVQPHCHQEATIGMAAELEVLGRLGVDVDKVNAGCCGLAGNFGFERGHWDVAQACAERELYPKVRAADERTLVVADGYSCQTQIAQGTQRQAEHLALLLHRALYFKA